MEQRSLSNALSCLNKLAITMVLCLVGRGFQAVAQELVNPLYRIEFRGVCSQTHVGLPGSVLDDGTGGGGGNDFIHNRAGKTIEIWLVKSESSEDDQRFGETHSWEFALGASGPLIIADITTKGTISCRMGDGPNCLGGGLFFNRTELTGLPYGTGPQTQENHGALSIILLGTEGSFLPGDGEWPIAKIRASGTFPDTAGQTDIGFIQFATRIGSREMPVSTRVNYRFMPVTAEMGNPPLELDECEIRLKAEKASSLVRCDANDDREVNISDAIWILQGLFMGGPQTACFEAADCNADKDVDVSDSVYLLSFLFRGGPAPAPPYPNCDVVEGLHPEWCPQESTRCQ